MEVGLTGLRIWVWGFRFKFWSFRFAPSDSEEYARVEVVPSDQQHFRLAHLPHLFQGFIFFGFRLWISRPSCVVFRFPVSGACPRTFSQKVATSSTFVLHTSPTCFRVWGLVSGMFGLGLWVSRLGFWVSRFGVLRFSSFVCRASTLGFRFIVQGLSSQLKNYYA